MHVSPSSLHSTDSHQTTLYNGLQKVDAVNGHRLVTIAEKTKKQLFSMLHDGCVVCLEPFLQQDILSRDTTLCSEFSNDSLEAEGVDENTDLSKFTLARKPTGILPCNHVLHRECIKNLRISYEKTTPDCPSCRNPFDQSRVDYGTKGGLTGFETADDIYNQFPKVCINDHCYWDAPAVNHPLQENLRCPFPKANLSNYFENFAETNWGSLKEWAFKAAKDKGGSDIHIKRVSDFSTDPDMQRQRMFKLDLKQPGLILRYSAGGYQLMAWASEKLINVSKAPAPCFDAYMNSIRNTIMIKRLMEAFPALTNPKSGVYIAEITSTVVPSEARNQFILHIIGQDGYRLCVDAKYLIDTKSRKLTFDKFKLYLDDNNVSYRRLFSDKKEPAQVSGPVEQSDAIDVVDYGDVDIDGDSDDSSDYGYEGTTADEPHEGASSPDYPTGDKHLSLICI